MRIKRAVGKIKKKRKIFRQAKGYYGTHSKNYRIAKQSVRKAGMHAYIGRKNKKRDMRRLWIARINAACRLNGISYSNFMHGLKVAEINLNRKVLAELAVNNATVFSTLCEQAKNSIK